MSDNQQSIQPSFDSARLKVQRANEHINQLEEWLSGIIQANRDAAISYKNSESGAESHMLLVQRPNGFSNQAALMIGDAAHNLRTALDHLASAIVIAAGEDPSRIYFPLSDTRDGLIRSPEYRFIERVAPDFAIVIADIIKPYKTANTAFWGLNRLDRVDKHRMMLPTITTSQHRVVAIREEHEDNLPFLPAPGEIYIIPGVTTADGIVTSVGREPRPGTQAFLHNQNNGYATVDICFGKGNVFEGESVIPTLRQLAERVSGTIETLEAHIKRGD